MNLITLLVTLGLLSLTVSANRHPRLPQEYLYVWAGHAERTQPDILAVLDFDCRSPTYGDFVTVKDVLGPSAVNNEPHHGAFNIHKDRFFSGGLLSLLKSTGQNEEIFAWKVEDPRRPEQLHLGNLTGNPRRTGVPDEFLALRDGGYFVSMMGDSQGNSPGGVLYISPEWYVEEFPSEHHLPKDDCFNPHGIAVDETAGILVTGDFVTPSSILTGGTPHFCDSIRIWDLAEMKIRKTIHLEQAVGIMNVNFVPGDPELRYIAAVPFDAFGTDVSLYVMDPEGNLHSTFHVTPYLIGPGGRCYSRINRAGTRMIIATSISGQVMLLDIEDLLHIRLLDVLQVAEGMHFITFNKDESRVAFSGYFLDLDSEGLVHQDGDRKVHIFNIEKDIFEEEVVVDFNNIHGESYRPHGMDAWWPTH